MKKWMLALSISFILGSCENGRPQIDERKTASASGQMDEKVFEDERFFTRYKGVSKKGLCLLQDYYQTGEKRTEAYLANCPFSNEPNSEMVWEEKGIEGQLIVWAKEGHRIAEVNYRAGLKDGVTTLWYASGAKHFRTGFKNGIPHGVNIEWFENGQKALEGEYRNGQPSGIWRQWYESGQIRTEARELDEVDADGEHYHL